MKKVYVLYDSGTCEVVRVFSSMEKAIAAAINRMTIFLHTCIAFLADEDGALIEYKHHDTGKMYALTVQIVELEGD